MKPLTPEQYVDETYCKREDTVLKGAYDTVVQAIKGYQEHVDAHTADPWISVEDELPEPGERVLVCYEVASGDRRIITVTFGEFDSNPKMFVGEIIVPSHYASHWMPLPDPPEEG